MLWVSQYAVGKPIYCGSQSCLLISQYAVGKVNMLWVRSICCGEVNMLWVSQYAVGKSICCG